MSLYKFLVVLLFPAVAFSSVGNMAGVKGTVLLNGKKASNGMKLTKKSVIRTKKGSCTLLIGGDVVVHLSDNSLLKVSDYFGNKKKQRLGMNLKFGKMRALAAKRKNKDRKIKIKTRTATMGIRGTHVYIDSPRNPKIPPSFMTIEGVAELKFNNPKKRPPRRNAPTESFDNSGPSIQQAQGDQQGTDQQDSGGPQDTADRAPAADDGVLQGPIPPQPSEEGAFVLRPNEMMKGDDLTQMDRTEVMTMAHSVAPPPPAIHSDHVMNHVEEKGTENMPQFGPGDPEGDQFENAGGPHHEPPQFNFDPILDGGDLVPVRVTFDPY